MCGFAGVVTFDRERFLAADAAREGAVAMACGVAHRGPDGQGLFVSQPDAADAQIILAHRRLAVLDLLPRSDQPFRAHDDRLLLVYNGEIYNFRQLREQIRAANPSRTFTTDGDTEVLLAAYETWGAQCVSRLRGMFAFAIVDRRDGRTRVMLARDRCGQKPLYVAFRPGPDGRPAAVAFASELEALRGIDWIDRRLRPEALEQYLAWGYVPGRLSIYRGIDKLLPGRVLEVDAERVRETRYFDAGGRFEPDPAWQEQAPSHVARALVEDAVATRLVADVPLGCLLSGGIDSSVVALCMTREAQRLGSPQVRTFSIAFDDPRYDESTHAAEVAQHLGTQHHTFHVTPSVAEDLPRLARVFGEPFGDSSALPTHYLCREVRQHVTVALGGDGGDEMFGGYDRYRALRLTQRLTAVPAGVRGLPRRLMRFVPGSHPKSRRARLRRLFDSLDQPVAHRYSGYMRLFTSRLMNEMYGPRELSRQPLDRVAGRFFEAYLAGREGQPASAAAALDRVTYLPDDLLVKLDRASMLHALEVRSPMLDGDIVRFASTLSDDQLLAGGGKRMLREAFAADLPASVFSRRKMGFAVPIGEWFRTSLRDLLNDALFAKDSFCATHFQPWVLQRLVHQHEQEKADHSQRLYALLMLEMWWRECGK